LGQIHDVTLFKASFGKDVILSCWKADARARTTKKRKGRAVEVLTNPFSLPLLKDKQAHPKQYAVSTGHSTQQA
jgi:hypothetical protein